MADKEESSWFSGANDFIKSFDTGGTNHNIWEGIEDIGRLGKETYLKKLQSKNTVQKGENLDNQNKSVTIIKDDSIKSLLTPKNLIFGVIGLIAILAIFRR